MVGLAVWTDYFELDVNATVAVTFVRSDAEVNDCGFNKAELVIGICRGAFATDYKWESRFIHR